MATCADTVPYCVRYGVLKEHVERVTCGGECHDEPTMFCLTAVPVTDLRAHHGPILGIDALTHPVDGANQTVQIRASQPDVSDNAGHTPRHRTCQARPRQDQPLQAPTQPTGYATETTDPT